MKKLFFFIAVVTLVTFTIETKAQKKPFVQWASVPKDNTLENTVAWLKLAMQGKSIDGAVVHASAGNYRSVWGSYYDQILSASSNRFRAGYATGKEQNFGIASNGASESDRFIAPGTPVIEFLTATGQWATIVKWGSNGCLNPTPIVNDYAYQEDRDLYDGPTTPSKPPVTPPSQNKNAEGTTVTINDNRTQDVSWAVGYGIYSQGRNDRQTDLIVDASIYTKIQDAKDCNPCGTSGSSTGYVSTGFQVAQSAPITFQQAPPQQVVYTNGNQQGGMNPWLREFTANTAANVAGEGLNRLIWGARPVRIVGQQQYYSSYSGYYPQYQQYPRGGGFQDSNQPGTTNWNTGSTGGNGWNTSGGNGGNTWNW